MMKYEICNSALLDPFHRVKKIPSISNLLGDLKSQIEIKSQRLILLH